jgi:hypothetical protein
LLASKAKVVALINNIASRIGNLIWGFISNLKDSPLYLHTKHTVDVNIDSGGYFFDGKTEQPGKSVIFSFSMLSRESAVAVVCDKKEDI